MEDLHYSSEEEEVFFGSKGQAELMRRQNVLGTNYDSPLAGNTPRPSRMFPPLNRIAVVLPDVLGVSNTSTPAPKHQSSARHNNDLTAHFPSANSSLNESGDDIIVLDNKSDVENNSVIVLSDDDSIIVNEEPNANVSKSDKEKEEYEYEHSVKETEQLSLVSNKDSSKLQYESFCEKDLDTISNMSKRSSLVSSPAAALNSGDNISTSVHESCNDSVEASIFKVRNVERNEVQVEVFSTKEVNESKENKVMEIDSMSLVQDINVFVGDVQFLENRNLTSSSQKFEGGTLQGPVNPESLSLLSNQESGDKSVNMIGESSASNSTALVQNENVRPIFQEDKFGNHVETCGESSINISSLSNIEFSLNGVTDSVLDISQGSSLPSPSLEQSSGQANMYEDISCDGENISGAIEMSDVSQQTRSENKDLHMSVDEIDCQERGFSDNFVTSINISQPSEYKSCLSAHSSYCTAYNDKVHDENHSISEQSNSFQNYRVASDDSFIIEEAKISLNSDEGNKNEASFEMVVQNRQNSFQGIPVTKSVANTKEVDKPKTLSKLPVFQSSTSVLRPAKLCIKPETLEKSSYKLAKTLAKNTTPSKLQKPGSYKLSGAVTKIPFPSSRLLVSSGQKELKTPELRGKNLTKTPVNNIQKQTLAVPKMNTPKSNFTQTKSKTPLQNLPFVKNKTPVQHLTSHIPKVVKSDTKVMRVQTPLSVCRSAEKGFGKSSPIVSQNKNRYRNVISPIHAYITGTPTICQVKAQIEEQDVFGHDNKLISQTKIPTHTSQQISKAVQRLDYKNPHEQENVNPNIVNPSRDTLPGKILESSAAVFWKEPVQPQSHLPKMGEKQTKVLVGSPKVKITVHEGRVKESPKVKGIYVENAANASSSDRSGVPDNDVLCSQSEGRISVRIQKTSQLP